MYTIILLSQYPRQFSTGGLGQLGTECARMLRNAYGKESVILSDIVRPNDEILDNGPYIFADILDFKVRFDEIVAFFVRVFKCLISLHICRVCKRSSLTIASIGLSISLLC